MQPRNLFDFRVNKFFSLLITILLVSIFTSCDENKNSNKPIIDPLQLDESLKKKNKEYIEIEDQQIDDYLERRAWKMNKTQTGIRYIVYQAGNGMSPKTGQTVVLEYSIRLIRGEEVYNSTTDGKKIFIVDQDDEISGLHELVKYLKVGDKVKAVIPSYLAYGIAGDENKIPRKATLFFDFQLMEIR